MYNGNPMILIMGKTDGAQDAELWKYTTMSSQDDDRHRRFSEPVRRLWSTFTFCLNCLSLYISSRNIRRPCDYYQNWSQYRADCFS